MPLRLPFSVTVIRNATGIVIPTLFRNAIRYTPPQTRWVPSVWKSTISSVPATARVYRWSQEERATLLRLRDEEKLDWKAMALRVGRGAQACRVQYRHSKEAQAFPMGPWTKEQTQLLRTAASEHSTGTALRSWQRVAQIVGRSPSSCRSKWSDLKGKSDAKWTEDEDALLKELVKATPPGHSIPWTEISKRFDRNYRQIQTRWSKTVNAWKTAKSTPELDSEITCRCLAYRSSGKPIHYQEVADQLNCSRQTVCSWWVNLLDPTLHRGPWSEEEDAMILSWTGRSIDLAQRLNRGPRSLSARRQALLRKTGMKVNSEV
ncbi:hypothetical protein DFJ77DRAFT_357360 [Powellomyces hirtus]|nr:hypothetical protein DFJ77DRAFT_357360 [Powellomyces hirtus]